MVIPLGTDYQRIELVTKVDYLGNLKREKLLDVVYVPLTSKEAQCPDLYAYKSKYDNLYGNRTLLNPNEEIAFGR